MHIRHATILAADREIAVDRVNFDAREDPETFWIHEADLPRIDGFEVHAHGVCRGEVCIPLAPGLRRGAYVDVAGLARLTGQAVVGDPGIDVWSFGEMPALADGPASRDAPDVVVPDRSGRPVHLAALRGKKRLVVTWASW